MPTHLLADGFLLQAEPPIYCMALPGKWLLKRSTPSWRIKDPIKGFQRYVNQPRAREIAAGVLDQQRTFPNSIVLATSRLAISKTSTKLKLPDRTRFFIVDGQHRIWAQQFSQFEARIACVVHVGLDERQMAELFLEINDNQKRVPSSLRWDLLRLVRPEHDPVGLQAAELVYELATAKDSPLFQHIDLTGEIDHVSLKQGSVAPEIKALLSKSVPLKNVDSDSQLNVLIRFLTAVRALDPSGWKQGNGTFYKARVLRALLKLLADLIKHEDKPPLEITSADYLKYLRRIKAVSLDTEAIRAIQGNAGIRALYMVIRKQALGR